MVGTKTLQLTIPVFLNSLISEHELVANYGIYIHGHA